MKLWEWVSIKYGDNRSDEQRAADAALKDRQAKALAKFKRHKAKLEKMHKPTEEELLNVVQMRKRKQK